MPRYKRWGIDYVCRARRFEAIFSARALSSRHWLEIGVINFSAENGPAQFEVLVGGIRANGVSSTIGGESNACVIHSFFSRQRLRYPLVVLLAVDLSANGMLRKELLEDQIFLNKGEAITVRVRANAGTWCRVEFDYCLARRKTNATRQL